MSQGTIMGKGARIPGGIPTGPPPAVADHYVVGLKRMRLGSTFLEPGTPIPSEVIASIPRLESWIRARRIVAAA